MSNISSADILELANNLLQFVCNDLVQIECRDALQEIEIKTVEKGQGYKENPEEFYGCAIVKAAYCVFIGVCLILLNST